MPRARRGKIELEYEVQGQGRPLLMIMGIGAQLVHWPQGFLDLLMARGFQVIRFDNRDTGRSSWMEGARAPTPGLALGRAWLGLPVVTPYTLSDMAADSIAVLEHLGLARAHVVGASMGGMIAQHLAFEHPGRLSSLCTIMSTSGGRRVSIPKPWAIKALLGPPARTIDEAGERLVKLMTAINAGPFPIDPAELRALGRLAFERGHNPAGLMRQMAAIAASGDRSARLRGVRAPTLVLHGDRDPLVPLAGGKATAAAIPGARLRVIEGMGHSLPRGVWEVLAEEIAGHAAGVVEEQR